MSLNGLIGCQLLVPLSASDWLFCCPYGWLELGYAPLPMTAISAKHEGEEKEL